MSRFRAFLCIVGFCGSVVAGCLFNPVRAQAQQVPRYEVDLSWPKLPLPDRWITGGLGGMCIDGRDHIYILNRQNVVPADLNAAQLAPPVIEFDPDGNVVRSWGDAAQLGDRLHDCHVDDEQNVWIIAAGTGVVQKYSSDGSELLLQIGETGVYDSSDGTRDGRPLNSDRAQFFLPASIDVDPETGDIYVADGETPAGNQRIAVLDRQGNFLRQWALHRADGEEDLTQLPHCLRLSADGLVYVCDRQADRIQVFDRMGTFIRNIDVPWPSHAPPETRSGATRGTAVVLAFSPDPDQRHLFVLNQNSVVVDVLDRQTGQVLSSFGGGPGRYSGQFTLPHGIAVDSAGNVYVAEQEGRRIQKFRVVEPVAAQDAPRTAWGRPDLQGVWDFRTITPMERPDELGEQEFLSDEEAASLRQEAVDRETRLANRPAQRTEVDPSGNVDRGVDGAPGSYNSFWFDRGTSVIATGRTSLVIDPPDGRIPALTPKIERKRAAVAKARENTGPHEPTPGGWVNDLGPNGLQARCITGFNSGPPMTPGGYNNNMQVFQTADTIVIYNEMNHNARIVPLDSRPHVDLPLWAGDSRGYWDGDTLVVETRNFLRETSFMRGGASADLLLTERFWRESPEVLTYEVTVNDPSTWTQPWTYQLAMQQNPEPVYEYACHEGNYSIEAILIGALDKE